MSLFFTCFILWFIWVCVGYLALLKVDKTKLVINWLDSEPLGIFDKLAMTIWPYFIYVVLKRRGKL